MNDLNIKGINSYNKIKIIKTKGTQTKGATTSIHDNFIRDFVKQIITPSKTNENKVTRYSCFSEPKTIDLNPICIPLKRSNFSLPFIKKDEQEFINRLINAKKSASIIPFNDLIIVSKRDN